MAFPRQLTKPFFSIMGRQAGHGEQIIDASVCRCWRQVGKDIQEPGWCELIQYATVMLAVRKARTGLRAKMKNGVYKQSICLCLTSVQHVNYNTTVKLV